MTTRNNRTADHNVKPLFLERWSPRAYDSSIMPDEDLNCLFEAARWAPSANNQQPWNFVYAKREDDHWQAFLDCLMDGNQRWAKNKAKDRKSVV